MKGRFALQSDVISLSAPKTYLRELYTYIFEISEILNTSEYLSNKIILNPREIARRETWIVIKFIANVSPERQHMQQLHSDSEAG